MRHLYNSVVRVERLQLTRTDGVSKMEWAQATDPDGSTNDLLQYLPCRIDLNYLRPGKDVIPAYEAGRAQDHFGVLFTDAYAPIKAGDRLVAITNVLGEIPVAGTFEIKAIPDQVVGFASRHHIEVQIVEVGQELTTANWPAETPLSDGDPEEPDPEEEP